ncbi:MAG TPA: hypothetical protein VFY40_28155 [Blastocatellia bacterium]|nr:hypothetical protein [Blastocatellia bacterium]
MGESIRIDSVVCAPSDIAGGVKSLYSVCEWLSQVGNSGIAPLGKSDLASWFEHRCRLYDYSYVPQVLIYPEVYQPHYDLVKYHVCFALGQYAPIKPHADLVVCKSPAIVSWVKQQHKEIPTTLMLPSIDRSIFEYDGRPKKNQICYMTRPHKHPEIAQRLRRRYGDKLVEIVNFTETQVAEALKDARVFVWVGNDTEGSPRPPKEALVAGCVVVGLKSDLCQDYQIDFGIKCSTMDELIEMAGESLTQPLPSIEERAVVRDKKEEMRDWLTLINSLTQTVGSKRY